MLVPGRVTTQTWLHHHVSAQCCKAGISNIPNLTCMNLLRSSGPGEIGPFCQRCGKIAKINITHFHWMIPGLCSVRNNVASWLHLPYPICNLYIKYSLWGDNLINWNISVNIIIFRTSTHRQNHVTESVCVNQFPLTFHLPSLPCPWSLKTCCPLKGLKRPQKSNQTAPCTIHIVSILTFQHFHVDIIISTVYQSDLYYIYINLKLPKCLLKPSQFLLEDSWAPLPNFCPLDRFTS